MNQFLLSYELLVHIVHVDIAINMFSVFAVERMCLPILTTRSNHHNAISSVSEGIIFSL